MGSWEIRGRLGSGGFGVVYDASGPGGHRGAVKTMHRFLAEQDEFLTRFGREISLAKRVQGDHVARVLDYDLRGDPPYLVTEFVEGPTLHDAVDANGPLEGDNLYALALALAEAITQVTDAGVIHRDLKPANVILTQRTPVLVDFGIASAAGLERITSTGMVIGTGPYMAPEQFTNKDADHRIDVFGWASVVTFAANGKPPFFSEEGDASAVMYQVLNGEPVHGALAGGLRELVAAAHAKDPADRPTIHDLVSRLVDLRTPATVAVVETPTELVEQTWHMPAEMARSVPPTEAGLPPTDVRSASAPATPPGTQPMATPAPGPASQAAPPPSAPAAPRRVVYTPPVIEPPPPAPQPRAPAPPYAPPSRPPPPASPPAAPPGGYQQQGWGPPQPGPQATGGPVKYRGDRLAKWVSKLPNFGKLSLLSAGVYVGFGLHFDEVNGGVPITSVEEADVDEAFELAWSFLPLVLFVCFVYLALRIVRGYGRRQGFTTTQWRVYAAGSAVVGFALAFVPQLATAVLVYGPVVLEPNDRITQEVMIAAAACAVVAAVLAIVGLVFAVIAIVNLFRALVGTVTY